MGTNQPGEFLFQYPILLPFHTVYGVLKARILKWFAIPFSSRSHSVLLELTPPKDVLFIKGNWNAKVGSQETPGVTGKFGLGIWNEAGQGLIEICQENAMVIANTLFQQHKRRLYTWTLPDGQHRDQIDYILCRQRWRSSIQSAKTRLGADCGSDHKLLIAKFRCKLKKVGTRSFSSVQFSCSVVSNSVRPHESQHTRPPCPSPTPQSLLRFTSIESVMPSSHLILCRPLLLLPPISLSIRVFSNESTLHMRCPKYWSFRSGTPAVRRYPSSKVRNSDCVLLEQP